MKLRRVILAILTVLALGVSARASSARVWEEIDRFPGQQAVESTITADSDEPISGLTIRDGHVYIAVRHASNIKVFTILGQLVIQQQLRPGYYRLRLGSRGIYLLKAGASTRRITL